VNVAFGVGRDLRNPGTRRCGRFGVNVAIPAAGEVSPSGKRARSRIGSFRGQTSVS
jgi:hypothetical protein